MSALSYWSLAPRCAVLATFVATGAFVHFRGQVRHKLHRQLLDHSTIMAPYNTLMYLFSAVPATPFLELRHFPELALLEKNWQLIRDDALRLFDDGYIRAAAKYNDLGFNSFFRHGWKRFYLKWYGDFLPSAAALCPHTTRLLADIPSIKAAMFALLPPGSRLGAHRDPFAGSLRYHLGLSTPNSEQCHIVVDGNPYYWKDGEAVIFDETYVHEAHNRTEAQRLVLLCDIERPLSNRIVQFINRHLGQNLVRAAATQNIEGEKVGALNKAFAYVYQIRLLGKKIKDWNRTCYYVLKWSLLSGLAYTLLLRV